MTTRIGIRFAGTHAGFAQGFLELRQALDARGLAGAARYNVELVFEEVTANIVSHGSPDGHALEVWVMLQDRGDSLVLTFEDNGVLFDPRQRPDPPKQHSLEEARIGGYGLMLVRHAASSIEYERTAAGRNRLTVQLPHG